MEFKINSDIYEIENYENLSLNLKTKSLDMLKTAKTVMDTLSNNGYIERGLRVEAYNKVLSKIELKLVEKKLSEDTVEL